MTAVINPTIDCKPADRRSHPVRAGLMAVVLIGNLVQISLAQTTTEDPLELARRRYNAQQFDEAIVLAEEARRDAVMAPAAAVVSARARLERFRLSRGHDDLVAAREALRTVDVEALTGRDRVELAIAFGQSLYFDDEYSLDDRFSAAAEQFEVALAHADLLDPRSRDRLFDWWAGALDRQAQQGTDAARGQVYARILTGAEAELVRDMGAASASYWLAAAAGGVGDTARAVGAAMAGWTRASALGERGRALRADLDRLMRNVILPERARELAGGGDPRPTLSLLETQWTTFQHKWAP